MTAWNIDLALPAAQQRFAFDLYRALQKDNRDVNFICSPLSLWCALLMPWMGARGETATALGATLHLDGLDRERVLRGIGSYIQRETTPHEGVSVEIANAIWKNATGALGSTNFRQSYIDHVSATLGTKIASCDFRAEGIVAEINGWVCDHTRGRIDHLVDESIINMAALLVNAASFDGTWAEPFDSDLTDLEPFHCRDGRTVSIPMMRKADVMAYAESERYQACRLPYGAESGFSLYLLLPKKRTELSATSIEDAIRESLDPFGPAFDDRRGTIWLPRFRSRQKVDLSDTLPAMGMAVAFDSAKADFDLMIEPSPVPFFLTNVIHEAAIDVDEVGTRAAAVSLMMMATGTYVRPPKPFEMRLDRPFFYAVIDKWPQTVLFMGIVNDPTAT